MNERFSLIPSVSSEDMERARAAVLELKAAGKSISVRSLRPAAGIGQEAATMVVRAFKAGELPPAADGPWTRAPWAAAKDAKQREADARELRHIIRDMLGFVHDEFLMDVLAAMTEAGADLRRVAARLGFNPDTDFADAPGGGLPFGPTATAGALFTAVYGAVPFRGIFLAPAEKVAAALTAAAAAASAPDAT